MPRAPQKINSYVLHDWETGGLDPNKNPVMSLAMVAIDGTTLEEIVRYDNLIKPYDKDLIYDPRALEVNGLTVERCEKEGITINALVKDMCALFKEANKYNSKTAKPTLVSHNAPFDRKFTQAIFKFCGVDLGQYVEGDIDCHGNFNPNYIDTIHWAKACHAPLTENTHNFKLGSACQRHGIDFAGDSHTALGDTVSLTDLFRYFLTRLRSGSNEVTMSEGKASINHRNSYEW